MAPRKQSEFRPEGSGATILTSYTERKVQAFPIFETELESLSFLNGLVLAFSSVASALLAFAVGIWTNAAFAERVTPEGAIMANIVAPGLCCLALISYGLAFWAYKRRSSTWQKVKNQSSSRIEAAPTA